MPVHSLLTAVDSHICAECMVQVNSLRYCTIINAYCVLQLVFSVYDKFNLMQRKVIRYVNATKCLLHYAYSIL